MQGIRTVAGSAGPTCLLVEPDVFDQMADGLIVRRLLSGQAHWWWRFEASYPGPGSVKDMRCERLEQANADAFLSQLNRMWSEFWMIATTPSDTRDLNRDMLPLLREFERGPGEILAVLFHGDFEPYSALFTWPSTAAGVCAQLMIPPPESWSHLPRGTRHEQRVWGESGVLWRLLHDDE